MSQIIVKSFFDFATCTNTYLVYDEDSNDAVVIDPVMNFDLASSIVSATSITELCNFINKNKLNVVLVLDTHAHADHLTGCFELSNELGCLMSIGSSFEKVQKTFADMFEIEANTLPMHYELLEDGESVDIGDLEIQTIATPGHTPACYSYLIGNALFTGDVLFHPTLGTGRCDFPGGSASDLYDSIANNLYKLPDDTIVYTGHDYPENGQKPHEPFTLLQSKQENIMLKSSTTKAEFVKARQDRDNTLNAPRLLYHALWYNIHCGDLNNSATKEKGFFKIPFFVTKL